MNHGFMSCKHKTAAPWDSSVAVSHIQRLIPKGKGQRGSEKRPYDESPELQSSCQPFCVVMVVSDGLRSTLIWSKPKSFQGEHAPRPSRTLCVLVRKEKFRALRAPHGRTTPTLCVPPPSSTSGSAPEARHTGHETWAYSTNTVLATVAFVLLACFYKQASHTTHSS